MKCEPFPKKGEPSQLRAAAAQRIPSPSLLGEGTFPKKGDGFPKKGEPFPGFPPQFSLSVAPER